MIAILALIHEAFSKWFTLKASGLIIDKDIIVQLCHKRW